MIKRKSFIFLNIFLVAGGLNVAAQGVQFEKSISWKELSDKARKAGKYIFLDCYATWCGPCKKMDRDVFTDSSVGNVLRENFISAKFQMDSTGKDEQVLKDRYADVKMLNEKYQVRSFPTLLFLTADGELLYRTGYEEVPGFIKSARNAVDSLENLPGLTRRFNSGELDNNELLGLLNLLNKSAKDEFVLKVAKKYKEDFLEKLPVDSLLKKSHVQFMMRNYTTLESDDKVFKLYLSKPAEVDSAIGSNGFSKIITDHVISKELVKPFIYLNSKPIEKVPNWDKLRASIEEKYGPKTADRLIQNTKFEWYYESQRWPEAIDTYVAKIEERGADSSAMGLERHNTVVYELILKKSEDKKVLAKAIEWIENMLVKRPDHYPWIDTYASLLYKIGKVDDAIIYEEKALQMAKLKNDKFSIEFYEDILKKMKNNEVIW